jgi:transcriptional regulator with XRE-family HTH domain
MRTAARLSGREFARLAGWADATNVTKIEKGQRTITADHVRLWCRICGASDRRTEELLAERASVARMWISYREEAHQLGLDPTQRLLVGDIYDRLRLEQVYQTKLIPGLLQTEAYMTGVLADVRHERGLGVDDVAKAVAERLSRQRNLRRATARFLFLIEEPVLWLQPFGAAVQHEQLRHLLKVMRLPALSLGVIPMTADRHGYRPRESFDITDDTLVTVELVSGFLTLTNAAELSIYRRAWADLWSLAVHGDTAAALIRSAMDSIGQDGLDEG